MPSQNNSNLKTGFWSIIIAIFYFLTKKQKEEEKIVSISKKYEVLYINQNNYKRILKDEWLLLINLDCTPDKIDLKYCSNKCNVAILTVNSLFTAKIAALFSPHKQETLYFIAKGHYLKDVFTLKKINFMEKISAKKLFDYYVGGKYNLFEKNFEKWVRDNSCEIIYYLMLYLVDTLFYTTFLIKN